MSLLTFLRLSICLSTLLDSDPRLLAEPANQVAKYDEQSW